MSIRQRLYWMTIRGAESQREASLFHGRFRLEMAHFAVKS